MVGLTQCEQRRNRRKAHDGRPRGRQLEAGVDEQRRPHEVDRDDLPPVGHGRGDTGDVGDGPQPAQLRRPRRQSGDAVAVLDVEPERLDLCRSAARREALCGLGQDQLVAVDQQQDVDHLSNPFGTGPPIPRAAPVTMPTSMRRSSPPRGLLGSPICGVTAPTFTWTLC